MSRLAVMKEHERIAKLPTATLRIEDKSDLPYPNALKI